MRPEDLELFYYGGDALLEGFSRPSGIGVLRLGMFGEIVEDEDGVSKEKHVCLG